MPAFLSGRVHVVVADITTLAVDLVVNAANAALCGGGGVDGAIHRAAGPGLLAECRTLGSARPGDVKLTRGYRLPARYIAHAVGPVWSGGDRNEPAQLASCYRNALALALEHSLATVAFPSISTGAYGYPFAAAATIALETSRDVLVSAAGAALTVTFCCFSSRDAAQYEQLATRLLA